jgi:hypothetical protein
LTLTQAGGINAATEELSMSESVRLTSLAHGGGCGCKIAPAVLREIMAELPAATPPRRRWFRSPPAGP